jgi:TonB-linked SusC/RagA family outer membrane protein
VNGKADLLVNLKTKTSQLDDVQIIAYGTTTRRLNTGNVSTVGSQEISEQPVASPLEALEGRVPGLFIAQSTGMPGSSFTVQLRGVNSIANGNDPLYIVDGVPYSSELLAGFNPSGGNPLNFIDPSSIASVEVLKDADATAIYGSRGANGVILITTKQGKPGNTKVDVNVYTGFGKITHKIDFLNTPEYLAMRREAFANDGATPGSGDWDVNGTWDTTRYTDWEKMLIGGTAVTTDEQLAVSGGNVNTQFSVGGDYHRQTTVFPGDLHDGRGSIRVNINNVSADQRFHLQLSGNYVSDNNNLIQQDYTSLLPNLPPDAPKVYNPDGTLNWANETWPSGGNPLANSRLVYTGNTSNLIANATLSYTLLKGLEVLTSMGYTSLTVKETEVEPTSYFDPAYGITTGSTLFTDNSTTSWIVEPQLKYQVAFGKGKLSALVGTTFQSMTTNGEILNATGYTSDALLESLQAAASISVITETNALYRYNAVFGRLNGNWADKYVLDLTVRRDGSSRFGPANQFANFGAVGAAWLFSRERFVERTIPWLSSGKLRASYGVTGNDQIGDYKFLNLYRTAQWPYAGASVLSPSNLYNPDLAWERNRKAEGGIELGFWKDRILGTVSYYVNRSSNELVNAGISSITGFSNIEENLPALVQNTGLELTVSTVNIKTQSFRWTSRFLLTVPRNKLLSFPGLANSSYNSFYVVGQPLEIKRRFHQVGVNDSTGLYQFSGAKGGVTYKPSSPQDLTASVNTMAQYYGGLSNSLQWKQFNLDFFFQIVHQRGLNGYYGYLPGAMGNQQPTYVLRRWKKAGDVSNIQQFSQNYGGQASSEWVNAYDYGDGLYGTASYVRLKNLSLSYNLSARTLQRMHMETLRFYIQGQNLITFTKYVGYDPETQSMAVLPPLRVLTAGIQITL